MLKNNGFHNRHSPILRAFSPLSLFSGGTPGAWYDPSDYTTLFQDSAGTTPVTAVEQPVGLMLDKSQGLVLGSELVTNGDFSNGTTGWSLGLGWTISGGAALSDGTSANSYLLGTSPSERVVVGKTYKVTFSVSRTSGSGQLSVQGLQSILNFSASGQYSTIFTATQNNFIAVQQFNFNGSIDNISVKELPGNHAFQATSASRPVLSARYNLLTKTEDFSAASQWTIANATLAAVTDGFSLTGNAGTSVKYLYAVNTVVAGSNAYKIYVKNVSHQFVQLSRSGSVTEYANFDLTAVTAQAFGGTTASITEDADGFMLCNITFPLLSNNSIMLSFADSLATTRQAASASVGVIYVKKPSLLPSNQSTLPYQRVNTATDYATTGFLPYLRFDGVDDSLSTNSISFTSTDKMSVFAGVRKLSDAAQGMIFELSAISDSNDGSMFGIGPLNPSTGNYAFRSKGTGASTATSPASYSAPITNVFTGLGNISGDLATLRVNNTQVAQSTADQGTGNYGNYPLYIGRRNNASLPFNGQMYSMVIVGKAVTAGELSSTETYVNQKTGAY